MIIAIDASRLSNSQATGVEYYSKFLIQELIKIASKQNEHKLVLYSYEKINLDIAIIAPRKNIRKFFEEHTGLTVTQKIIPKRRFWTQYSLAREVYQNPPDLLFVPSHVLPRFLPRKVKKVATIHDLAFKHLGQAYNTYQAKYLNYTTKYTAQKADKIIVPSAATQKDLIRLYNFPAEKIEIIPHGPPPKGKFKITPQILEKFNLTPQSNYILYIGRLEEKKNLVSAIRGFSKFAEKNPDWQLVLAGKKGIGFNKIIKTLLELKFRERIILTGYLPENEKTALYTYAKALIIPSFYEGFGLTALEAFQYNLPVIAANYSSLPEVCGEAACFIDPFDAASITAAFEKIASQPEYCQELIEKGKLQLKKFSWQKTSHKTWQTLTLN